MNISIKTKIHLGGATYEIFNNFKRLLDLGFIDKGKLGLVTIFYEVSKNNIESAPVKLYFTDGIAIYLNLTAGYGGTGPRTTNDILSLFNIPNYTADDIMLHQNIVNLKYELTPNLVFVDDTII